MLIDEETAKLAKFVRDTASVHEACLKAFKAVAQGSETLKDGQHLRDAVNMICIEAGAPSFCIDDDDGDMLFMKGMNFAGFFATVKDYFTSALQAMSLSEAVGAH